MLQKLCFILTIAIILGGCGASAPDADVLDNGADFSYGRTESIAAAQGVDTEAAADEPEEEICEVEYFAFHINSDSVRDDEGRTILLENYASTTFVSDDPARKEWVDGVIGDLDRAYAGNSNKLLSYAREFISTEGMDYFYAYSNYRQLGVARHDEVLVSLVEQSSLYSGGSHPNTVQTAYNLDIENRRLLRLEDVIEESAAPDLAALVLAGVGEKFVGIDLFEDYGETIASSMVYGTMTPYWYMNDRGLVVFYNQYELGPYAAGIIKTEIPYAALRGIIREDFLPVEREGDESDLYLARAGESGHLISVPIQEDGQRLLIAVEGKVYQVQISEIFWVNDTPVGQDLIFSARTLCHNDVLEIIGGFDDENRSFAIEFIDGRGVLRVYYLHPDGLQEQP